MKHMILGIFTDSKQAGEAVTELNDKGFSVVDTGKEQLTHLGISEEAVKVYEHRLKKGETLVIVSSIHEMEDEVKSIMKFNGADENALIHIGN